MLWWRTLLESISTLRASANARKVKRPMRLTVVMRANTDAHEPVASMRYPEKYTMRTPAQDENKITILSAKNITHILFKWEERLNMMFKLM